jgi:hypothetical protein
MSSMMLCLLHLAVLIQGSEGAASIHLKGDAAEIEIGGCSIKLNGGNLDSSCKIDMPTTTGGPTTTGAFACASDTTVKKTFGTPQTSSCHNSQRCGENLGDGVLNHGASHQDWLVTYGTGLGATADFTLDDGVTTVSSITIYPQHEYVDGHRDVKHVEIYNKPDGVNWVSVVTSGELAQSNRDFDNVPTTVEIPSTAAPSTEWRVEMKEFWSSPGDGYYGFMEIEFYGCSAN